MLLGRWWKFTYDQIHDDSRTEAHSAKTFKKGFRGFCYFRCLRNKKIRVDSFNPWLNNSFRNKIPFKKLLFQFKLVLFTNFFIKN